MSELNNPLVAAFQYLTSLSDEELKSAGNIWMRGSGSLLAIATDNFIVLCNPDAGDALLDTIRLQNLNQEELDPTPALHDIVRNNKAFFVQILTRLKEIKEILLDNGSVRFREDSFY